MKYTYFATMLLRFTSEAKRQTQQKIMYELQTVSEQAGENHQKSVIFGMRTDHQKGLI
jgi:hypothetical protein